MMINKSWEIISLINLSCVDLNAIKFKDVQIKISPNVNKMSLVLITDKIVAKEYKSS